MEAFDLRSEIVGGYTFDSFRLPRAVFLLQLRSRPYPTQSIHGLVHRVNQRHLRAALIFPALIPDDVLRDNTCLLDKLCIFLLCVSISALLKVNPFHFRLDFEVMDIYLRLFRLFLTRTCEMKCSINNGLP